MRSHFEWIKMKHYQKGHCKVARDTSNLAQLLPNEQMELTYFPIRLSSYHILFRNVMGGVNGAY